MKIAVASGKGGTGKTFLATNLFKVLADRGDNVILVDCDAEAPDAVLFFKSDVASVREVTHQVPLINKEACTFCDRCSKYCQYNAIFYVPSVKMIDVIENLCHSCGACFYACNSEAITEKNVTIGTVTTFRYSDNASIIEGRMKLFEMTPVKVIKEAVREAGSDGIIIFDAPPGTSCPFVQTVDAADYVILVTEPTPFGLSDLRQSVETLKVLRKKMGVVVNRADIGNRDVFKYLESEEIRLLAEIPYDGAVAHIYSEGKLAVDFNVELTEKLISVLKEIIE